MSTRSRPSDAVPESSGALAAFDFLHVFSTFAVGGPQRRFAILANAMPNTRHRLVAMDGCYDAVSLLDPSVSYEIHDLPRAHNRSVSAGKIIALRSLMKTHKADIVYTYNWGSIEAVIAYKTLLRKSRRPAHIHFEDGFGADESPSRQLRRRALARRILLRDTRVVLPSRTLEALAYAHWGLSRECILYMPNGVDVDLYTETNFNEDKNDEPGYRDMPSTFSIGSVGIIRREKNLPLMLDVFEAVINRKIHANLSIIGHGPEYDDIVMRAGASRAAKHISLYGYQVNPADFYRGFDIFLITSDTEQMPLSVLEAMASGLPVVATDVGDIRHMLSDENAPLICPKGDMSSLVKAIETLATNPALRCRIGKANRQRAEKNFSQDRMIENFAQYVKNLVR